MNTVPNEKPAAEVQPGEHLIEGADDVALVQHALPYTDTDHQPMVALTVLPLRGDREPFLARFRSNIMLRLATDAEIAAVGEQQRRIALAEALRDVAEQILVNRLPVDYQVFDIVLDTRAEAQRWATAYGLPMPEETSSGKTPALQIERDQVRIQVMYVHPDTSADDPEGWRYSRPAEGDVEPVDPPAEGEGWHAGRTGNTGEQPIITKTAAERDDTTSSADATATDPGDRVDGLPSGSVRAAAAPVAPLGVGATGVTPDGTAPVLHIRQIGAYRANLCPVMGGEATWPSNATCEDCKTAHDNAHAAGEVR